MFYWHWFRRRQHPLARILASALGLVLLAGVLVVGAFALAAFVVIGGLALSARAAKRFAAPTPATASVIEGEYVVLPDRSLQLPR